MRHTPGPWLFEADEVTADDGDVIVADLGLCGSCAADEWQRNGHLIAAAPDLYEALAVEDVDQIIEAIEIFVMGPIEDEELNALWQPYIDKLRALRAAIAKADGR